MQVNLVSVTEHITAGPKQRLSEHTQLEHRQVAVEVAAIFESIFPNVSKVLSNV